MNYAKKVPQADFLDSFDYLAFHTPFAGMVKGAHRTMMRKFKKGTLKSGQSKTTVKSRKQAIAIGLSEARKKGRKVPAAPRRKKTS
jgi:3-hydroxy-3-methylglutaryl CoA synthase